MSSSNDVVVAGGGGEEEEQQVWLLSEKGDQILDSLLLNIHQFTKQVLSMHWDPVQLHTVLPTKTVDTYSSGFSEHIYGSDTPLPLKYQPKRNDQQLQQQADTNQQQSQQPTDIYTNMFNHFNLNDPNEHLDRAVFEKDTSKTKEVGEQCLEQLRKLTTVVNGIVNLELSSLSKKNIRKQQLQQQQKETEIKDIEQQQKIEDIEMQSTSTTTTTTAIAETTTTTTTTMTNLGDHESKVIQGIIDESKQKRKELSDLKHEAHKRDLIIKKLIDQMRLLQLSINTMNKVSIPSD
ncbi:putative mediator complex subunit 30 [Cavenderia fasciculata]|uniref:Mediator complex subunit 30 n=1 Tax=Cavenderia fasciculata TaxID=261658 RepID=F4PXE7_CACFS|nr:putative mediator complex subunit 30 [Cavenderia fasciculata]EGG19457.1 putative mediator complex subunit 30 [Cavenderia fasciculata]|eukprot:XP_004357751.1 putative mediator complex subunit 30 [Cavenderia fasciculata]